MFAKITTAVMNTDDSVKSLITQLDKICMANTVEGVFSSIENFEQFRRTPGMTIANYLEEFDRLKGLVDEHMPTKPDNSGKRDCNDSILAFRMMKQANLVDSKELMVRAHVNDLTSEEMSEVLKRIFGERLVATGSHASSSGASSSHVAHRPEVAIKQETYIAANEDDYDEESVYAGNHYSKNRYNKRSNNNSNKRSFPSNSRYTTPNKKWQKNPPDVHIS